MAENQQEPKPENTAEDSDDEVDQLQYKVIVLGDGAVGKTSICMRFCDDYFAAQYKQTIGVDFMSKKIVLPGDVHVTLQIWDIGGQSLGSKMIRNYIFGAQAVVLAYDVTNYQSFQDLQDWLGLVHKTFEAEEELPYLALVGNKADLQHLRSVKTDKHMEFAATYKAAPFFVSAKTGDNINAAFMKIAADLAEVKLTKGELEAHQQVVTAAIINSQQHDPAVQMLELKTQKTKCVIQ